nr:MAG: hypothetical protein [Bacteriophage sp.]
MDRNEAHGKAETLDGIVGAGRKASGIEG